MHGGKLAPACGGPTLSIGRSPFMGTQSKLPTAAEQKVDLAELTWEDKEQVLRMLFAKINHAQNRRATSAPQPGMEEPVDMGMDNQAAIAISYNPEFHSRTKHIDRRHFYVRECVENMELRVPFVKTTDNLADFFTKPLPSKHFFRMRNILMNVPSRLDDSRANEHLDRDGEPREDFEEDYSADDVLYVKRRRQRGPRQPRAAARAGG